VRLRMVAAARRLVRSDRPASRKLPRAVRLEAAAAVSVAEATARDRSSRQRGPANQVAEEPSSTSRGPLARDRGLDFLKGRLDKMLRLS